MSKILPENGIIAYKKSGKPFKSKLKFNTLKERTVNPNTKRVAWTFLEDNSIVDECKMDFIRLGHYVEYPSKPWK